jgi:ABC-type multidrug transport system permease subunit
MVEANRDAENRVKSELQTIARIPILAIIAVFVALVLIQLWIWTAQFAWSSDSWLMVILLSVILAGVISLGALILLLLIRWKRRTASGIDVAPESQDNNPLQPGGGSTES